MRLSSKNAACLLDLDLFEIPFLLLIETLIAPCMSKIDKYTTDMKIAVKERSAGRPTIVRYRL